MTQKTLLARLTVAAFAGFVAVSFVGLRGQAPSAAVAIDNDDIGGVVTGARGPEAGVWVIAETTDTPTRFIKIVVTDDQGRYLVPDLPNGAYDLWVRGYGLVDSPKVKSTKGQTVDLRAVPAPDARAAAQYYPAQYWFALMQVPPASDFPGTGPQGNGISPNMRTQGEFIRSIVNTDGCSGCHQMGNKATRELLPALGTFETSTAAWDRRIQSGQAGGGMNNRFTQVGRARALEMYASWTDRIAKGELPTAAPARPQGRERNMVVTMWDWADPKAYLHDEIATDKRNPTVNANGPIYGALEESADYMPVVDPKTNSISQVKLTVRDPNTPSAANTPSPQPSPYWGDEVIWSSKTSTHSFAMDGQARVWAASRIRAVQTLPWCRAGSDHPSAKAFPIQQSGRQLEMYDPKTRQTTPIDTCYSWGHANFDKNDVLWSSFGPGVEGWFDTRIWDRTHDEQKAQGWTAFILDTNGNGKRDVYSEPNEPADPMLDRRLNVSFYGVSPASDGSVWGSVQGMPGGLGRLVPGPNPPATALTEYYEVPFKDPRASGSGFSPRGMDIDSKDVVWTVLSSGQLASFDRRLCKGPLNGPNATGKQCPEGWKLYAAPGPNFKGAVDSASSDSLYYNFTDQFDMLGLGKDVPIATGNQSEALLALVDGAFLTLRVPYPLGFFAKGMDGRIDDPNGGWKGKAIYTTFATRAPFHLEGGKGTTSKLVKVQVRPNSLAK
ncbi:MAG: carboxypeptidase-like regulatory domain-containing protein [Vicinamibacterales bacterium]